MPQYYTSKSAEIPGDMWLPHYTNSHYRKAQTIFLADGARLEPGIGGYSTVDGLSYDYDDRFVSWFDEDKRNAAIDAANATGLPKRSAGYMEAYLRVLFDAPNLELVHIMAGHNLGNGYPYKVYGYRLNN